MTSKERFGGILAALETVSPLLQVQVMSTVGQLIAEAVAAEREACAQIVAGAAPTTYCETGQDLRDDLADQIRSRSTEASHA